MWIWILRGKENVQLLKHQRDRSDSGRRTKACKTIPKGYKLTARTSQFAKHF